MTGPLKPFGERQRALAARFPEWQARTLDQMLAAVAGEYPDRPFVITDKRSYSYREMDQWASRLACGLAQAGVEPGDHVALVMANYPEFVALKFAISRVGATTVPINFLNRAAELGYVLGQSDASLLITMDRYRDLDYLAMLDELAPGWETGGGGSELPRLRRVFVFPTESGHTRPGAFGLGELENHGDEWSELPDRDPQGVSDILYTSGTTGGPKGVLLTHDMFLRTAYGSAYARGFQDGRRLIFSLPMYHVFGYVEGLLSVLFVGGAIIPQIQFDPDHTLAGAEKHRAHDILLIPTMTQAVLPRVRDGGYDLSSVVSVFSSGGKSPPWIWDRIFELFGQVEVSTGYGMTEATASTTVVVDDSPSERLTGTNGRLRDVGVAGDESLGRKLVAYRVVDTATGEEVPPGEMGELRIKGPGVTRGYYKKPEETAAAFDDQGWMRTGDLGTVDNEDYLRLLGRTKESYRCGGEQVLPGEIEDLLLEHPAVDQAFVVPVPDDRMGEAGAACIIPKTKNPPDAQEFIEYCAQRLARFKVPKYVLFITQDELPTTATGRPRKFLLTEQAKEKLGLS